MAVHLFFTYYLKHSETFDISHTEIFQGSAEEVLWIYVESKNGEGESWT